MRFALRVVAIAFKQPSAFRHRYRAHAVVSCNRQDWPYDDGQQVFEPTDDAWIPTRGTGWSQAVEVERSGVGRPQITFHLLVLSVDPPHRVLEELEHSWSSRYYYDNLDIEGDHVRVRLMSDSTTQAWRRQFYVRRASSRSFAEPQVLNVSNVVHLVIDPVIPTPASRRVVLPAWVHAQGTQGGSRRIIHPPSSINPSVIPAAPPGRPSDGWLRHWRARVMVTHWYHRGPFRPQEVSWRFEASDGSPTVEIAGRGLEARVYGRGRGEGNLIASARGRDRAQLRVLVREPARLRTRAIAVVSNAPHSQGEAAVVRGVTEQELNFQIQMANRFLRQVAIQLGHAELTYEAGASVAVDVDELHSRASTYGRDGFVTFVLIYSATELSAGTRVPSSSVGIAAGIPRSTAPSENGPRRAPASADWVHAVTLGTFVDRGTPSSSLRPPTGIPPDDAAEPTRLTILREAPCQHAVVYLLLRAGTENGLSGATIAHEVGHVLNLAHRNTDGVGWLGSQNLMLDSTRYSDANDLDIAQAKVMWHSPLVQP